MPRLHVDIGWMVRQGSSESKDCLVLLCLLWHGFYKWMSFLRSSTLQCVLVAFSMPPTPLRSLCTLQVSKPSEQRVLHLLDGGYGMSKEVGIEQFLVEKLHGYSYIGEY